MPSSILVTGGHGKLGSALGRIGTNALGRDTLDITRSDNLAAMIDSIAPSLVINCAAYTAVDKAETETAAAFTLNRDGAENLAKICAGRSVPLIHVSTDCVFGDGVPGHPVSEADPARPLSIYGQSKREGEMAVEAAGGRACIARVSWLFDYSPQSFIGKMLTIAHGRDNLNIVDDAYGRPTEVNALAKQLLDLADVMLSDRVVPPLLHLGPKEPVSRFGWAEAIFAASAALGGPSPALARCTSDALNEPARRPRGLVLDTKLADALLGKTPDWNDASNEAVARILKKGFSNHEQ